MIQDLIPNKAQEISDDCKGKKTDEELIDEYKDMELEDIKKKLIEKGKDKEHIEDIEEIIREITKKDDEVCKTCNCSDEECKTC